jgi:hypothetical protein
MRWRRVDPVQPVAALFVSGETEVAQAEAALGTKSALFQTMKQVRGSDWLVWFATRLPSDDGVAEAILPSVPGMQPLYEDAPGWWLPVGMALDVPDTLSAELRAALCIARNVRPPFLLVPRFENGADHASEADLYELV